MSAAPTFDVLLIGDEAYEAQLAVAARSVLTTTPSCRRVIIVGLGLPDAVASRLCALDPNRVLVIDADPSQVAGLPTRAHFAEVNYARLFVDRILPSDTDLVVYLDADLVVVDDLVDMVVEYSGAQDLAGCRPWLGAVRDWSYPWVGSPGGLRTFAEHGIAPDTAHFNSGVLVFSLQHWRAQGFCDRLRQYVTSHRFEMVFVDQDALNICASGAWHEFGPRWNVQVQALDQFPLVLYGHERLQQAVTRPAVIHYPGPTKPWNSSIDLPFHELWRQKAAEAGFAPCLLERAPPVSLSARLVSKGRALKRAATSSVWRNARTGEAR